MKDLHIDDKGWAHQRVNLNGIWYIVDDRQEVPPPEEEEQFDIELIGYKGLTWENENYCFELDILTEGDKFDEYGSISTPSLKFTTKEGDRKDWIDDYWDNSTYLIDILHGKKNADMVELFNVEELQALKLMIGKAIELQWFKNVEEHDELIIENWNKIIGKRDTVYILGDVTMENKKYEVLDRLTGYKKVVGGNHDLQNHARELLKYVQGIAGMIKYKGCALTHCPVHPSQSKRFRLNIHGHVHENTIHDDWYVNVCAEVINYTPISFEEILESRGFKK